MQGNKEISPYQEPRKRRLRLFVCTFLVCCTAGMAYTFLRPPVYLSTATLLVSRRTTSSEQNPSIGGAEQDVSIIAVQRHLALRPAVISRVLDRFAQQFESGKFNRPDGTVPSLAEVAEMLSAHAVPETSFLELRAEGGQPAELTFLVETWIDVFLAGHAATERKMTESNSTAIHKQLGELKERVEAKRRELAAFRDTYDIASIQREENRALARLNGLTKSLSSAEETEAIAAARLDALKAALSEGRPIDPSETDQVLVEMETRAAAAREWLFQREALATEAYLAQNKRVAEMKEFLRLAEGAIQARCAELERRELSNAELEMATAQETVARIRNELTKQEQAVSEFTTRFAEHEAISEDLRQLEALHRQLLDRVVQTEVVREALPPELSVAQNASVSQRPIRPDYSRDAVISLVVSLLFGLAAVAIDFIATRPLRQSTQLSALETRTVYYPLLDSQTADGHTTQAIGNIVKPAPGSHSMRSQSLLSDVRNDKTPSLLRQLEDAITAKDVNAIQRLAHAIKGAARNLAAVDAEDAAARIEESVANNDLDSANQQMSRLREAVNQLLHDCEPFLPGQ